MRLRLLMSIMLLCICVTGCKSVYNLTAEESDLIAEYAAGILSKNAFLNKDDYQDLRKYLAAMEAEKEESDKADVEKSSEEATLSPGSNVEVIDPMAPDSDGGSSAVASNMAQVLGLENVEITCLGYEVTDMYPKDEFAFSTTAAEGRKLIVVQYELMNLTSDRVIMNINEDIMVKAVINNSSTVRAYATLLNDDILNMNGRELSSGEVITGVFIFQVNEELCQNIASLNVVANK